MYNYLYCVLKCVWFADCNCFTMKSNPYTATMCAYKRTKLKVNYQVGSWINFNLVDILVMTENSRIVIHIQTTDYWKTIQKCYYRFYRVEWFCDEIYILIHAFWINNIFIIVFCDQEWITSLLLECFDSLPLSNPLNFFVYY